MRETEPEEISKPAKEEEDIEYDEISDDELDDLIGGAEDEKEENQDGQTGRFFCIVSDAFLLFK